MSDGVDDSDGPTRRERWGARWHGWVDSRLKLRVIARPAGDGQEAPELTRRDGARVVWTPYIQLAHDRAAAASDVAILGLCRSTEDMVGRLLTQADHIVHEAEAGGATDGARRRFQRTYAAYQIQVTEYRTQASQAVWRANMLVQMYWDHCFRRYRRRNPSDPRTLVPARAVLDPVWDKPDPFALLGFGDDAAGAMAGGILRRALEIVELSSRKDNL